MPMPKRFIRRPAVASMLLIVVAALGACASTPAPVQQLAVAEAAVQHANTASTQADAPMALRVAVDKLAAANRALAAGDRDRARVLGVAVILRLQRLAPLPLWQACRQQWARDQVLWRDGAGS